MPTLFDRGDLRDYLQKRIAGVLTAIERVGEDEFLVESVDSMLERFTARAQCGTLALDPEHWVDGDVQDTSIDVTGDPRYAVPWRSKVVTRGTRVIAEFSWQGNRDLFFYTPSTRLLVHIEGDIREGTVAVTYERPGDDIPPDQVRQGVGELIGRIATTVSHANADVTEHNNSVESLVRAAIEERRARLLKRRDLRGALGFEITRRQDAPRIVPVDRKVLGPQRREAKQRVRRAYQDEWALADADYEDVLAIITGMLRACERTPSVVKEKDEESLRDLVLIVLNGTYQGMATGETFVVSGKTDILVRIDDRHVFVGECKWWDGAKACAAAVDQLLGYLPWRDEKAALLIFIDRKNASAIIDKADDVIRNHPAFKRVGPASQDSTGRGNYVLGHPHDSEREIKLAVLFAVI